MKIYKCSDLPDKNEQCYKKFCWPNCRPPCPIPPPCPPPKPCPVPPPCPPPKPYPPTCSKVCQNQEGNQNQDLGDLNQSQGDQTETLGDLTQVQGSETQGDQTETLGDLTQVQGSETQGDQTETLGDLTQVQGSETQGDQTETLGDLTQVQGGETQGDQTETLGDLTQVQGSETQGDQTETLGDLTQVQGGETQGDQTETLGDLTQVQGSETQGDQNQGDQLQSLIGHGGQTQGEQNQTLTGHGGQAVGDQTLSSSPSISTPVNVSGVNVNVTVSCCDQCKKQPRDDFEDCKVKCRRSITSLLSLIRTFSLVEEEPEAAQIGFYSCGLANLPTEGSLKSLSDCTFGVLPESEVNEITVLTDSLEALSVEFDAIAPSLFTLLLAYLKSLPDCEQECLENSGHDSQDYCCKQLQLQLQGYCASNAEIEINLAKVSFTGFIYKISNGIAYLTNNLTAPTVISAIPLCKILSYQPK